MPRYAAFLRGINISNRRVGKTDLRLHLEWLGLEEVGIFRASGNVVFTAGREQPAKLTARIEDGLASRLGFEVVTYLRTADEVRAIARRRPFPRAVVERSKGRFQVAFLLRRPPAKARKGVLALATDDDRLAFGERELYWLPSGGTMQSGLNLRTVEKLFGPMTLRTMGTVEQIAAKHF
jgi:uncharacterized protein (DUF1697 family)